MDVPDEILAIDDDLVKIQSLFPWALRNARLKRKADYDAMHKGDRFGASTVGGCPRVSIFARMDRPSTNPPGDGLLLRWDIGHFIEEMCLKAFDDLIRDNKIGHLEYQAEAISLNDQHVAHTDALFVPDNGGSALPVEMKSIDVDAIKNNEREHDGKWVAYSQHIFQVAQFLYHARESLAAGKPLHHYITLGGVLTQQESDVKSVGDSGLIKYISLRGWQRESTVRLSHYQTELEKRLKEREEHWNNGTLPERLPDAFKYPCGSRGKPLCAWWDVCWGKEKTPLGSIGYFEKTGMHIACDPAQDIYTVTLNGNQSQYTCEQLIDLAVGARAAKEQMKGE